jgi:hypothetical protein
MANAPEIPRTFGQKCMLFMGSIYEPKQALRKFKPNNDSNLSVEMSPEDILKRFIRLYIKLRAEDRDPNVRNALGTLYNWMWQLMTRGLDGVHLQPEVAKLYIENIPVHHNVKGSAHHFLKEELTNIMDWLNNTMAARRAGDNRAFFARMFAPLDCLDDAQARRDREPVTFITFQDALRDRQMTRGGAITYRNHQRGNKTRRHRKIRRSN